METSLGSAAPSAEVAHRAIARHRALFNARDREGWLANFVDDPFLEEPVGSGVRHGRQHFAAVFDYVVAGGLAVTIDEPVLEIVCGSEVAVHFTVSYPPAAGQLGADIIEVFTIAPDGRVAGVRAFANETPDVAPAISNHAK